MYSTIRGNRFSLFFLIFYLSGSFLVMSLLAIVYPPIKDNILLSIAATQLILVFLPTILYLLFVKLPITKTLRLYPTKPINLLFSFLIGFLSIPTVMLINLLSQFIVSPVINETLKSLPSEPFGYSLLVIAVFPAIFEEMATRGIFLSHYRHTRILTASLMSGLFFGIIHMNLNQFLYAFFLGTLFSIILHITGSIICPMIMHFVVNGVNLGLSYIAAHPIIQELSDASQVNLDAIEQTEALLMALPGVIIMVLVTLPLLLLLIYALIHINNKMALLKENAISSDFFPHEKIFQTVEKQPIFTLPFAATLFIFISFSIYLEVSRYL
ncbi:type II CAAX endopeptidase family protein [Vallitaleaceae bacterium 9-2]